jgi:hypothetical protein
MPSSIFTSSTSIFLRISPLYPTLTFFYSHIPHCPTAPSTTHHVSLLPPPLPLHRRQKGDAAEASRTGAGHPSLPPKSTRAGRRLSNLRAGRRLSMELHAAGLKSRRRGSGGRSSSSSVSSSSPAACTSGGGEGRAAPSSRGGPLSLHVPRRPNRGVVLVGRHQQLPAAGRRWRPHARPPAVVLRRRPPLPLHGRCEAGSLLTGTPTHRPPPSPSSLAAGAHGDGRRRILSGRRSALRATASLAADRGGGGPSAGGHREAPPRGGWRPVELPTADRVATAPAPVPTTHIVDLGVSSARFSSDGIVDG